MSSVNLQALEHLMGFYRTLLNISSARSFTSTTANSKLPSASLLLTAARPRDKSQSTTEV
jgi:hypothetical protein